MACLVGEDLGPEELLCNMEESEGDRRFEDGPGMESTNTASTKKKKSKKPKKPPAVVSSV
jgi:hypothetical protein